MIIDEKEETDDYYVSQNKLIFKPFFNKIFENLYIDLILKYDTIIFSNYHDLELTFKTDNSTNKNIYFNVADEYYTNKSLFNQKIKLTNNIVYLNFGYYFDNSIQLNDDLRYLFFGHRFNQQLKLNLFLEHLVLGDTFNKKIILNDNLKYLSFGCEFNQPIKLNEALEYLIFGFTFNQPIQLNNNLKHLTLSHCFNQPLKLNNMITYLSISFALDQQINLSTSSLRYLKLDTNNEDILDLLNDCIEELELGFFFNLDIRDLPNSIKKIIFDEDSYYDKDLNCLPDSVEILHLPRYYNKKINILPKSLKTIKCYCNYSYIDEFETQINIITYQ